MSDADFKLREFPDWPDEQVIETARMLYALRPFKIDSKSELQWNSLAREAFDFLDNLHKACNEIARRRGVQNAAYRSAENRAAEAEENLLEIVYDNESEIPEQLKPYCKQTNGKWTLQIVPLDKAIRLITHEKRTKRAETNFKKLVLSLPDYFGGLVGKPPTLRTLNAWIKRLRNTGIPRREVLELQSLFDGEWPRIKSSENRAKAKKRKPWPEERRKSALSATFDIKRKL
jgi:hypothetical protein